MKKNKKEKQNYYFAWTCGVVVSIDEGEVFFYGSYFNSVIRWNIKLFLFIFFLVIKVKWVEYDFIFPIYHWGWWTKSDSYISEIKKTFTLKLKV